MEERGRRVGIENRMAPLRANAKIAGFAATLTKGAHVHVEGDLRSREYEKAGLTRKIFECRVHSILKLDRAVREEQPNDGDDAIS